MTLPVRRTPFLIQSRDFPADDDLEQVLSKMYTEVSFAVNERSIGIYDKFTLVNGDRYFNDEDPKNRRQAYRQVYELENISATTSIAHNLQNVDIFVKIYGSATTASKQIPLPYVSVTATDIIQLDIDTTTNTIDLTFGATAPTIVQGIVVLEFLLNNT